METDDVMVEGINKIPESVTPAEDINSSETIETNEAQSSIEALPDGGPVDSTDVTSEEKSDCVLPKSDVEPRVIDVEEENIAEADSFAECDIVYDFSRIPVQITGAWKEFEGSKRNNFTKGCKWAPDGSCVLTCSDDNCLRIFNLAPQIWDTSQWSEIQEMEAVVKVSEGELIYDYCWYPRMNSASPATCCFISSSRGSTVHLRDGFTGELRCSYRTYNHLDEIVAPHSVCFDSVGGRVFCGFEKFVRVFRVDSPGRNCEERRIYAKGDGQPGIVSCFAFAPLNPHISVAGSYQKSIGIYSEPSGNLEHLLEGQKGGVTQVQFSPDGTLLYSGGRKDPEILCWDLRNLGTVLYTLRRCCLTNQRMQFDVSRCGRYVVSGNHNGVVSIWDVTREPQAVDVSQFDVIQPSQFYMAHDDCVNGVSGIVSIWDVTREPQTVDVSEFDVIQPSQFYMAHDDCVNGVSLHPSLPLLCSSSGQRQVAPLLGDEEDGVFAPKVEKKDNSLRLWWIGTWS